MMFILYIICKVFVMKTLYAALRVSRVLYIKDGRIDILGLSRSF